MILLMLNHITCTVVRFNLHIRNSVFILKWMRKGLLPIWHMLIGSLLFPQLTISVFFFYKEQFHLTSPIFQDKIEWRKGANLNKLLKHTAYSSVNEMSAAGFVSDKVLRGGSS